MAARGRATRPGAGTAPVRLDYTGCLREAIGPAGLTRDELLFLIKVARENYSFIVRTEKEARLALAAKLHKTAEAVFGVTTREE